ncbi:MAG TPA: adenylosuccinate synthetase, partial [Cupriavidus sp.]|nr:adenylosuccinate synthetase [Cupriavidus sp.]
GVDEVYLNKCDSLAAFAQTPNRCIPVVVSPTDGDESQVALFPAFDADAIPRDHASPLPPQLETLLEWLADALRRPLRGIGLGPERNQMRLFRTQH